MFHRRFRRLHGAVMACAILLSGAGGGAEVVTAPVRVADPGLALRLLETWRLSPRLTAPRPLLVLASGEGPLAPIERSLTLAPTLKLSVETLRLLAGHSPARFTPFIGWSTNSLGLRIRF